MRRDKLEASEGIEEASKENKEIQEGNKAMRRVEASILGGKGGKSADGQEGGKRGNEEEQTGGK